MSSIYLDNSATTPVLPEVWEAMRACGAQPGNAASSHAHGRRARRALEDARERIAELLGAEPDEVIFTSGATEANNLGLFGLSGPAPGAIVTSPIEHPCVLEPARRLAELGYRHVLLPVTRAGSVEPAEVDFPEDTRLACIMLANHETGALQPVQALAQKLQDAPLHCDAAAAAGKIPISFRSLGVRSLTVSAHKFHGPQGIGALIMRRPGALRPLLWGGHQQQGKRPGTESAPLAVGMAVALEWCLKHLEEHCRQVQHLRQTFLDSLHAHAAPVVVNSPAESLPHVVSVAFPGCKADALMMNLDLAGVACSAGSACSSGSLLPSHVLKAMAVETSILESSLRFSFSPLLRVKDTEEAAQIIALKAKDLRQPTSP
jgi:cysteine desulfurase